MSGRLVIIGGGAAGLMATIAAKSASDALQVTLLEKMPECGRKLRITGKGRGNITNTADMDGMIKNIVGNGKFLYSALRAFDNNAVIAFFNSLGVATKTERGGRVFPVSDRATDIRDALTKKACMLGANIVTNTTVRRIIVDAGRVKGVVTKDGQEYVANAVILAAGGASYPATGSGGDGVLLAKETGHSITPLTPALVPLETAEDCSPLQGLSLKNVRATLLNAGEKNRRDFGEMMFAHFGVTGPIILSLSRYARPNSRLLIDFKPALDEKTLDNRLQRDLTKYARRDMEHALVDLLPQRLITPTLTASHVSPATKANALTKEERRRLLVALKNFPLTITKPRPWSEAIVTAGGVNVKEINPKTMESKIVGGLYFAGEVMDVDALTGGFNLQAAFSTGYAAGTWATKTLSS